MGFLGWFGMLCLLIASCPYIGQACQRIRRRPCRGFFGIMARSYGSNLMTGFILYIECIYLLCAPVSSKSFIIHILQNIIQRNLPGYLSTKTRLPIAPFSQNDRQLLEIFLIHIVKPRRLGTIDINYRNGLPPPH